MQASLTHVSSDLPRLCCMVQQLCTVVQSLHYLLAVGILIHSKFHVILAWITGVMSFVCNVTSMIALLAIFFTRSLLGKQLLIVIMSFNITLADVIVSVCLTSLSINNVYYRGVFGIYADMWRESMACYTLELSMFVCTECSLIFSVYLAVASYINITSLIPKPKSAGRSLSVIVVVWPTVIVFGICKVSIWEYYKANDFNYYCLPYQIVKAESVVITAIQTGIITANILLIGTYILIQYCLLKYLRNHAKVTLGMFKSRIQSQKIAVRMSCLIISHVLTWTPILVTQLVIMYWKNLNPSTLLLILLVSLPANLVVNPIILVTSFLNNK